jgi:hypothetical protein
MKTRLILTALLPVFFLVARSQLGAQLAADPNDRLYTDLSLWQERALISQLPQLRPYPIQLLRTLLEQVKAKGNVSDGQRAERYLSELQGLLKVHMNASLESRTDFGGAFFQIAVAPQYQGVVTPYITYSGTMGVVLKNGDENSMLPTYARSKQDFIFDGSATPIGSTTLTPFIFMLSDTAFGSDSIYGQVGLVRSSFGPFWGDNAVLSPDAPSAGRLAFIFHQGIFTYTGSLFDLAATQNNGGGLPKPDKFLTLHSLEVSPWDWLTVGIFESVVWGGRFEPLYLMPFPTVYYAAQGTVGFPDNSFIGLSASISLPASLKTDFLLYVDDADVFSLIKLNFNTKLLAALQAGLSWTPNLSVLTRISLNGLIVTPYTYTHTDNAGDVPTNTNYQNYTNNGQSMGPSLLPDSARIRLNALLRPAEPLDVVLFGQLILHGNASEGIPGGGDGSLFDSGVISGQQSYAPPYPLPPGMGYLRFLTQSNIQKVLQTGVDAKAYIDTPVGEMQVGLSYTFEYLFGSINNYVAARLAYQY